MKVSIVMRWVFGKSWLSTLLFYGWSNLFAQVRRICREKAYETVAFLRQHLTDAIQILGPTPKPIARTHNLYHYQIILKYRHEDRLEEVLNQILDWTQERENQDLRLIIDNEPQNMMRSLLTLHFCFKNL